MKVSRCFWNLMNHRVSIPSNAQPVAPSKPGDRVERRKTLYVVLVTLSLFCLANLYAGRLHVNPLTIAQNKKIMFTGPRTPHDPVYSGMPVNRRDYLSILYVGNSQSYAIMDFSPGDRSMITALSEILNGGDETGESKYRVRFGSDANLRMSELLIKCVAAAGDAEHRPDVVVIGVVLDGLRWIDARAEIAEQARTPFMQKELRGLIQSTPELALAGRAVEAMMAGTETGAGAAKGSPRKPAPPTVFSANAAEEKLQSWLDRCFPVFQRRKDTYIFLYAHYENARNTLLGISTATRRPLPRVTYQTNLELIGVALQYLHDRGTRAAVYFGPIRPITPNPYDPEDIKKFREDLKGVCTAREAAYLDYSNVVPEELWTKYPEQLSGAVSNPGQRDYAHFTGRGHREVAQRLARDLLPELKRLLEEKARN
jgi:hypothetical protein